jgi:hypothetical protein
MPRKHYKFPVNLSGQELHLLFKFVMSYNYHKQLSTDDRILFFCQIASQYAEGLNFTDKYETSYDVEYPLIYSK